MIKPVQALPHPEPLPADAGGRTQEAAPAPKPVAAPAPQSATDRNVRLTIDPASSGPFFVYTLTDRDTGRIIAQLPRQEVAKAAERPDYSAGDVIRTKV